MGGENQGTSLSERVRDIAANPGKYYFNFHSVASWAYWSAVDASSPVGMCRGVMKSSEMPMAQSSTLLLNARSDPMSTYRKDKGTDDSCFTLFSSMAFNNLMQSFPNNPDSQAAGLATFKLCTNGSLVADTALVYGGETPLIASHIHYATNGDGTSGSGPPVISFCGSNTPGLINAAGPYPEPCAPYMGGSSNNANMMGYFIPGENEGTSLSQRVLDIAANPGKYYFNFHSIASWAYWSAQNPSNPQPVGMCRGVMKSSSLPMEQSNTISLGAAFDLNMASAKPSRQYWLPLGGSMHNVAEHEGNSVGKLVGSLEECEMACEKQSECKSFALCGDACYLKGKSIASGAPSNYNKYCTTFRKDAGTDDMCFNLFTSMAYNNLLQSFPNNPDSHAEGMATFKLCTNGTLIADTALVYGGQTPLIASHIHRASNDDGENGSGPPVISFCGSNTPGLINAAGPYPEPC